MPNYKNCRNAKTAEEYLLKCLFQAEDEHDKAVAYCNGVREAEEERIKAAEEAQRELEEKAKNAPVFEVKETKTVSYEVADDYRFYKKDYGLAYAETLTHKQPVTAKSLAQRIRDVLRNDHSEMSPYTSRELVHIANDLERLGDNNE